MATIVKAATGVQKCTEFRLKVMVFSPESGYKFDITVQRKCFPTKWFLIFNLYKKKEDEEDFVQLVGIEFDAEKKEEEVAIEDISKNGINMLQSRAFKKNVFPAAKALEDDDEPTEAEINKINNQISKAIKLKDE